MIYIKTARAFLPTKWSSLAIGLLTCAALPAAHAGEGPSQHLQSIRLSAGIHNIQAEVAQTDDERMIGLMNRTDLAAHQGMLFVFPAPAEQCFWMKNTPTPLTAAFVADDGTIVNLVDMKPKTLDSHCSAKPVRFVLEMNQGWFAKRGIKAGSKLSGAVFSGEK